MSAIRPPRPASATFASLFAILLAIAPAWAQCENLPRSELSVDVLVPKMRVEVMPPAVRQGSERLTRIEAEVPHPALTIEVVVAAQVVIDQTVVRRGDDYCAAPRELTIRLGLTERLVGLPAAASRSACVREALLTHAREIEAMEQRIITDFLAGTRERFYRTLGALKKVPASTSDEAYRQFRQGVEELVDVTVAELRAVRLREVDAAEAHADHTDLAQACDGALQDIVWPHRRRAQMRELRRS